MHRGDRACPIAIDGVAGNAVAAKSGRLHHCRRDIATARYRRAAGQLVVRGTPQWPRVDVRGPLVCRARGAPGAGVSSGWGSSRPAHAGRRSIGRPGGKIWFGARVLPPARAGRRSSGRLSRTGTNVRTEVSLECIRCSHVADQRACRSAAAGSGGGAIRPRGATRVCQCVPCRHRWQISTGRDQGFRDLRRGGRCTAWPGPGDAANAGTVQPTKQIRGRLGWRSRRNCRSDCRLSNGGVVRKVWTQPGDCRRYALGGITTIFTHLR